MIPIYRWFSADDDGERSPYDGTLGRYMETLLAASALYLVLSIFATAFVSWDVGRKRWWAGPYLTGMLSFGDGSAPIVGLEKWLLKFGITSACEDMYFTDHLHDGSHNKQPIGKSDGTAAPIPALLLWQGLRGRQDDPFPERFHSLEQKQINKGGAAAAAALAKKKGRLRNKWLKAGLNSLHTNVYLPVDADQSLDKLLVALCDSSEQNFLVSAKKVRTYLLKLKRKRLSNLKLKALLNAYRKTPEFMAAIVRQRRNSGRNVLRKQSLLERSLPQGWMMQGWISTFRKTIHDASHYGQSRFRSQSIAVMLIITGQMHAIASFTSTGYAEGEEKRLSNDVRACHPARGAALARTVRSRTPQPAHSLPRPIRPLCSRLAHSRPSRGSR
eukprot:1136693-Prymnesium_polylepis.3